jgi:hypothetical protein
MRRRSFLKAAIGALAALALPMPKAVATRRIVLTPQTFCPGIWSGMEGARIDVFDTATGIVRHSARLTSVDIPAKILTVEKPIHLRVGDGVTSSGFVDRGALGECA